MKLGYIDYLNCFPFYYHMFHIEPIVGVDIVPAYPSQLNAMLKEGYLHMSPISSAAYAVSQDEIVLLPDFCLSSIGYVRSVVLASKKPIENLNGCTIGLSNASQTSVVLLKIILQKFYGFSPYYVVSDPFPTLHNVDAKLIIGNEAMMHEQEPLPYIYDLGDLWLSKTGYPVVFALFAVRRDAIKNYSASINRIYSSYSQSLNVLKINPNEVIECARHHYPNIVYDIATYYSLLQFDFSSSLKDALLFYFATAAELSLLPQVKSLEFYGM